MLSFSAKTARNVASHLRRAPRAATVAVSGARNMASAPDLPPTPGYMRDHEWDTDHEVYFKDARHCAVDRLHYSELWTDHFQRSLPHLPVPQLEKTCERYLRSQRALLSDEEYAKTQKIVSDFQNGVGKKMHEDLVAFDKQHTETSYVTEPWFDMYLRDRRGVVLNHNPFMSFADEPDPFYNEQDIRATNYMITALRFWRTWDDNCLIPEIFHLNPEKTDNELWMEKMAWTPTRWAWYFAYLYKAFPLDMSQFNQLFRTTRIPRPEKDEIFTNPEARHMLVMRNGNFYVFDVLNDMDAIRPEAELLAIIRYILNDNTPPPDYPLGIMTSQNRDTWATVRQQLIGSGNEETLNKIDSAFFNLCLDDVAPSEVLPVARNFLYGGDGKNRWADKSFSFIVQKDGRATVNFEHSWGDGVAVVRMMNEVHKYSSTWDARVRPETEPAVNFDPSTAVTRLEFNMTDETKAAIVQAKQKFKESIDSLDMDYLKLDGMGKDYIKKNSLGPDSFMQLAIQMAYWRLKRQTAATYESCSTSAFKKGRTETVRPLTVATRRACELFDKKDANPNELYAAMKECTKVHNQLTKEAAMGQGWDRHLFALKYYADKKGETADIFKDPNYEKINRNILSTSTVSSPALQFGGFGPVIPEGYGVGYAGVKDFSGYLVTTYKQHNKVSDYLGAMDSVYKDFADVLERRSK